MEVLLKFGVFLLLVLVGFFRGRANERRHGVELEREEARLATVLTFATKYPAAAAQPMDPVLVTGAAVMGTDFFRILLANLRKVVGGHYVAYERLIERGRRQALLRLKQSADAHGARMVFNVRYTTTRISNPRMGEALQVEVLATGTAFVPARGRVADSAVGHRPSTLVDRDAEHDLMRHRVSRRWVIAWFVGVAYAMVELLIAPWLDPDWRFAHGAPLAALLVVAALATLALGLISVRRWRLRTGHAVGLGVATVPMLMGVLYFGALRLNALTADTLPPVAYVVQADRSLAPASGAHAPRLRFEDFLDYWVAQPADATVPIELRRGLLGFWQYNAAPLRERYRAWYQARPPRRPDAPR